MNIESVNAIVEVVVIVVVIVVFLFLVLWNRKALVINPKKMGDKEMLDLLRRLCIAYEDDDRATIWKLHPQAIRIGEELNQRGGPEEMQRIWKQLENMRGANTLYSVWESIGDSRRHET